MKKPEPLSFHDPYPSVQVSLDREIRTLTALRPYRPSGFVLRREKFGEKALIHNYGHGGCGVTLSWGCAEEAALLLAPREGAHVAVLGAGVIGLTTARMLQEQGANVTIYADKFSPDTTSDVAGALWYPVTLYDEKSASAEFLAQFRKSARRSYEMFTELREDTRYGVYPMRFFEFSIEHKTEGWAERHEGQDLYPNFERVSDKKAFGFPDGLRYEALMIDPQLFLPALMEDIKDAGGTFVERKFGAGDELHALEETSLVNCTGYGAGLLFGDEEMTPVRGQLTLIEGQPEIDYGYALGRGNDEFLYMFPRRGSIVLGGTKYINNESLEIDDQDRLRILDGHREIAQRIAASRSSEREMT